MLSGHSGQGDFPARKVAFYSYLHNEQGPRQAVSPLKSKISLLPKTSSLIFLGKQNIDGCLSEVHGGF